MKIIFNRVNISNFMSIGEASIDLADRGYTLVSGVNNNPQDMATSNGSGKSSILEALVWCLTGDTMRGNKSVVNSFGTDGALVTLEFTIDGNDYRLVRSKDHSKYKTNLKIYINDEDKSGKGVRDTEKLLSEYLPDLTPSLIGSVVVLGQGLPTRFTNNTPSGRKEVLEKLCKSDFMIQDLKERITNRKSELSDTLRNAEDSELQLKTRLQICSSDLDNLTTNYRSMSTPVNYEKLLFDVLENIKNIDSLLNVAEGELDRTVAQKSQLEQLVDQNTEETSKLIDALSNECTPGIDALKAERYEALTSIRALEMEINRLSSIKDTCPTCGQKLQGVETPDTTHLQIQMSSLQSKLNMIDSNLSEAERVFNQRKEEIFDKNSVYLSEIKAQLRGVSNQYQEAVSKERELREKKFELSLVVAKLEEEQRTHTQKVEEIKQKIESVQNTIDQYKKDLLYYSSEKDNISLRLNIINKFNTLVTRDFRGYLLTSIIEFINKTAKKYCEYIFETDLINFTLDGNNISISYNGKEYEALSGGERQKVDLIIQFSIREMLCKHVGFSTNIIALDEIFDNLDDVGCSKVLDLISKQLCDISSIFIITHRGSELNIPCDNEIVVTKGPDGISHLL